MRCSLGPCHPNPPASAFWLQDRWCVLGLSVIFTDLSSFTKQWIIAQGKILPLQCFPLWGLVNGGVHSSTVMELSTLMYIFKWLCNYAAEDDGTICSYLNCCPMKRVPEDYLVYVYVSSATQRFCPVPLIDTVCCICVVLSTQPFMLLDHSLFTHVSQVRALWDSWVLLVAISSFEP